MSTNLKQRQLSVKAAYELLVRKNALEDMRLYRPYIYANGLGSADFQHTPAPHHKEIIWALHGLENGRYDRLMIMAPPGSAKSTYVSVQYATWAMARHPSWNILALSNSSDLAETFQRRRRSVILGRQWQLLAEAKIDPNSKGLSQFGLVSDTADAAPLGVVACAGAGSNIIGRRADLIIADDLVTSYEESLSSTQMNKLYDWWFSDAMSRLVPHGKVVMVGTRWAANDPMGRILEDEGDDWHVLRLPMLADSEDDPLGREIGEPLWPDWYGDKLVQRYRKDPWIWSSQYQQVPLNTAGSWVPEEQIRLVDEAPDRLAYVIAVDLALSVGKGDYTAIVVAGLDVDRNIYVVDVRRHRQTVDETVNLLVEMNSFYDPQVILIDDDPAAKVFTSMVHETRNGIPLYPMRLGGKDKETRAGSIRGWFNSGRVRIKNAPWTPDLLSEIYSFPTGSHDDQIDCLSLIGRHLAKSTAPSPPRRLIKDKPVETFLTPRQGGGFETSQTLNELWQDHSEAARQRRADRI